VISGSQKESHLACNHEAQLSPYLWRRVLLFLRSFLFTPPLRFAEGKQEAYEKWNSRRCLRRNLPFLPGPWPIFIEILINEFGDDPKIKKCLIKFSEF